ncbi:MAG TPA: tetratricopeptide repeat protein [Acidobacteriota bacterium]|nr:tetratricopeptide repeat protein [Acidobacteriota bacterium]
MKHSKRALADPTLKTTLSRFVKLLLVFSAVAFLNHPAVAQGGSERLFDEGNLLYQQQDFQGARDKYLQIETQGEVSSALYYNLANSYYKIGNMGKAVLYYERALRLDPGDDDIQANLRAANQATADQITPPQEFELARWLIRLLYAISTPSLINLAIALYLAACVLLTVGIVSRNPRIISICKRGSIAAGAALLVIISIVGTQCVDSRNRVEAIVIESELRVMGAPDDGGLELFRIHEGTKVRVDQSTADWIEIVLLDGKVGWVQRDSVEII